jgi:RNA polymerase sigma factor (sigma-70 family)
VNVDVDDVGAGTVVDLPETAGPEGDAGGDAKAAVAALYRASAVSLIRLAYVMVDDLPSAEDVVQEAFCGLYRQWDRLKDADSAMFYVRASVLNGCRSVLRRRAVRRRVWADQPPAASAEAVVLSGEELEVVFRAVGRLPHRQREVLVLRFYLDLPDEQIARVMGIRSCRPVKGWAAGVLAGAALNAVAIDGTVITVLLAAAAAHGLGFGHGR